MKFILICCSFLVVCTASVLPDVDSMNLQENSYMPPELEDYLEANYPEESDTKIVGGDTAKANEYPYHVGLDILSTSGVTSRCSGALLSRRYVITVAHCLVGATQATVILGAHDRDSVSENGRVTQVVPSTNFRIHGGWNIVTRENNIALIRLISRVRYTAKIRPIDLPRRSDRKKSYKGVKTVITGWGIFDPTNVPARRLQHATADIISNKKCAEYFGRYIFSSHICLDGENGRGTCSGDSGGPMAGVAKGKLRLMGLASFETTFGCHRDWPTVFTRITSYLQWIKTNANLRIE